jgi:hypothetical protein
MKHIPRLTMAVVLAAFLWPGSASAQPEVSPAVKKQANRDYAKGQQAYRAKKYEKAVESFLAAYKTWPRRELLFNISMSYGRLGDKISAVINLRGFIKDASPKELALVPKWLNDMQDEVAVINIQGPAGAVVSMDGKSLGEVPQEVVILPGMHLFVVERGGKRIAKRDWDVPPGLKRVWEVTEPRERPVVVTPPEPRRDPPPPLPPPPPPPRKQLHMVYALSVAGLAAVFAAAAAGTGAKASSLHTDYKNTPTVDLRRDGMKMVNVTNAMWGVAGACAVTSVVLAIFTRWRKPKERSALTPTFEVGPDGARVGVSGRF